MIIVSKYNKSNVLCKDMEQPITRTIKLSLILPEDIMSASSPSLDVWIIYIANIMFCRLAYAVVVFSALISLANSHTTIDQITG